MKYWQWNMKFEVVNLLYVLLQLFIVRVNAKICDTYEVSSNNPNTPQHKVLGLYKRKGKRRCDGLPIFKHVDGESNCPLYLTYGFRSIVFLRLSGIILSVFKTRVVSFILKIKNLCLSARKSYELTQKTR